MDSKQFTTPAGAPEVRVRPSFFSGLMDTVREKLIPYQWDALNDALPDTEPSGCLRNFRAAAGLEQAEFTGKVFQDSDLAKWIECAAWSLAWKPDPELEARLDEVIAIIGKAQREDGYLDTYYILGDMSRRWTNLMANHELYCAGHMLEAAVAYYRAVGKTSLLDIMVKCVEHIASVMGPEEGKLKAYPGHEVLEMALCALYEATGEQRHLELARYFIDQRGQSPLYFEQEYKQNGNDYKWARTAMGMQYYQAGRPVREQHTAEGHAVRAGYLYAGMADVARLTGDDTLYAVCRDIWTDIVERQLYITGAVGQSRTGEAFSFDYDLPNGLVYGETCASIALAFFARRMMRIEPRGEYGDAIERVLYNGALSGMSLDGRRFFYVNPLEVIPERCAKNEQFAHVKPERQKWFSCACCPPNLGRFITSLPSYMYHTGADTVYINLYNASQAALRLESGAVTLSVATDYPWEGRVDVAVDESCGEFAIALRIPGWCCGQYSILLNGALVAAQVENGFATVRRCWACGDVLTLELPMRPMLMHADPRVWDDAGKAAVQRGPVVYCLEEADNGPGLQNVYLDDKTEFTERWEPDTLGGVVALDTIGWTLGTPSFPSGALYAPARARLSPRHLRFIPYYAWANRGVGEMTVWVKERL